VIYTTRGAEPRHVQGQYHNSGSCSHLLVDRNDFAASVLDTFGKSVLLKGLVEEGVLLVERDSVGSIRRAKH
jgi:hypothetical protein